MLMNYDKSYYECNAQNKDRPALWFYERIWRRYCKKGTVLEFGCGVGFMARRLSRHAEVIGLEINPYALSRFCINAPNARLVDSLEAIGDNGLESIVALHVLEHIPDSELALIGAQFYRILCGGGRLVLVMPDSSGFSHSLKGARWLALTDNTHVNLKSAEQWRIFFEEKWGFKVIDCSADGYYDFPYGKSISARLFCDSLRAFRTAVQFILGRLILPVGDGEAVIFILEKCK